MRGSGRPQGHLGDRRAAGDEGRSRRRRVAPAVQNNPPSRMSPASLPGFLSVFLPTHMRSRVFCLSRWVPAVASAGPAAIGRCRPAEAPGGAAAVTKVFAGHLQVRRNSAWRVSLSFCGAFTASLGPLTAAGRGGGRRGRAVRHRIILPCCPAPPSWQVHCHCFVAPLSWWRRHCIRGGAVTCPCASRRYINTGSWWLTLLPTVVSGQRGKHGLPSNQDTPLLTEDFVAVPRWTCCLGARSAQRSPWGRRPASSCATSKGRASPASASSRASSPTRPGGETLSVFPAFSCGTFPCLSLRYRLLKHHVTACPRGTAF